MFNIGIGYLLEDSTLLGLDILEYTELSYITKMVIDIYLLLCARV